MGKLFQPRPLGYEKFFQMVTTRVKGISQENRLRAIWKQAPFSIGCDVTESVEFEAEVLVETLTRIREIIRSIDERIRKFGNPIVEFKYLITIPGFGPDTSAKVIAALGNPFRFNNTKRVLKLAGLDLSANRSGKISYLATPVISKKGKAPPRYALYQAAFVASTRNNHFIAYFTRIR